MQTELLNVNSNGCNYIIINNCIITNSLNTQPTNLHASSGRNPPHIVNTRHYFTVTVKSSFQGIVGDGPVVESSHTIPPEERKW